MLRTLLCVGALASCALPCRAELAASGSETRVRFTVAPAAAPTPALRYRLLPDLQEMNPGNPIQGYLKAIMAHQKFFRDEEEASARQEPLFSMPLKTLPVQEEQREYGRLVLAQTDRAARLDRPDWQVLPRLKTEGFTLLLPDVQQLRALANPLEERFHSEIALGHFDEALRTAKTLFAMVDHLGEHPTLIGNLVGIAIAYKAIEPLEEMMGQPGSPNLYWALTTLPSPLIPVATGMEGERTMLLAEFRDLDEQAPMDVKQIKKFAVRWDSTFGNGKPTEPGKRVEEWMAARAKDEAILDAARRRLIKSGVPEERLRRFPPMQVILLDEKRECLARFDDVMKTTPLPHWQAEPRIAQVKANKAPALLADDVVPSMIPARRAQGRLEQRLALLRHVEALRLYAEENQGTLPAKLSDVTVPLPDDPFTGKPFPYELRDGTAHLRGGSPLGEEMNPAFNTHFEVTLQK